MTEPMPAHDERRYARIQDKRRQAVAEREAKRERAELVKHHAENNPLCRGFA